LIKHTYVYIDAYTQDFHTPYDMEVVLGVENRL